VVVLKNTVAVLRNTVKKEATVTRRNSKLSGLPRKAVVVLTQMSKPPEKRGARRGKTR
jgi:hypothetical protein